MAHLSLLVSPVTLPVRLAQGPLLKNASPVLPLSSLTLTLKNALTSVGLLSILKGIFAFPVIVLAHLAMGHILIIVSPVDLLSITWKISKPARIPAI